MFISSYLNKVRNLLQKDKKQAATPVVDEQQQLDKKTDKVYDKAQQMEKAYFTHGVGEPFTWPYELVEGCPSWWQVIAYDKLSDIQKREAVNPIYKFKTKDTLEVVGAEIETYDRVHTPDGLAASLNRKKVKEISVQEYKDRVKEYLIQKEIVKAKLEAKAKA